MDPATISAVIVSACLVYPRLRSSLLARRLRLALTAFAVARALASRPAVIFADEPTGNLDSVSSREVLELLRRAVDEFGQTVVMVTHDPDAAKSADEVIEMADGKVVNGRPAA